MIPQFHLFFDSCLVIETLPSSRAAIESIGVYWIPVYDVLAPHGIQPCLTNSRNMKNVQGKRTDFHERQWIQHLHSIGVLHAAFRPDADVCAVPALIRHSNDLVEMAS